MARANTIQTNFTAGEISPLMYGRVDVNKYFNGARKLTNMIALPQGGAYRRPGTQYRGEVKTSANYTIMRKFVFSSTQAFSLEFGNQYIRFWNNSGPVLLTGIPYEISTPYLSADLPYLCFSQSADVIYITHGSYKTRKLARISDTSWTLTEVSFDDGPYLEVDQSTNIVQAQLVSDITTLLSNASGATTGISSTGIFNAASVGKYVEYVKETDSGGSVTSWGLDLITSFTNSTTVGVTVQSNIINTNRTVTFGGGQVTAHAHLFTTASVGKMIRLTASQAWYLITGYVNPLSATATAVTLVTYTYPTTKVINQAGFVAGDVGKYIEFKKDGFYRLAKILTVISSNRLTVQVMPNILVTDNSVNVEVPTGSGNTSASHSGVFVPTDKGKFVRDTNEQRWGLITGWNSSTSVATTAITMFSYIFPGLTMTLADDRVITVNLSFRDDVFDEANDVGVCIRLHFGSQWRWVRITSISSGRQAVGTMNDYLPFESSDARIPYNNGFAEEFRLPAWSTANGWPALCCFHQTRLVFASNTDQPTTKWFTQVNSFESFSPSESDGSVLDTNAITITIVNNQVNKITWMKSGPVLLVGTEGDEFQVKPSTLNQALTPTNITVVNQTSFGSVDTDKGSRINSQTLFIQRGGLKIREMTYSFQIDAFDSRDVSIISEHLFRLATNSIASGNPLSIAAGAIQMDFGHYPVTLGWIVMADGTLLGVTYEREQDVIAFHPHIIGGSAKVESVCVVPDANAGTDIVWLIVARTINGSLKRYVESFTTLQIFGTSTNYMDSWKVATTQIGDINDAVGFNHLTGATVQVMVDGLCIGNKTVGATTNPVGVGFNLKYHTSVSLIAGFQCSSIVGILEPEGGSGSGSSQAKKKHVSEIAVRVDNSPHMKIASGIGDTDEAQTVRGWKDPTSTEWTQIIPTPTIAAIGVNTPYPSAGTAPVHYTADILATSDDPFNNGGRFHLVQDEPYALRIACVMLKLDTNE